MKALPAGHFIGGGDSGGGPMGLSGVQPAYPRTQYSSQFSGTHPPRVNVRDVPHPPIGESSCQPVCDVGYDWWPDVFFDLTLTCCLYFFLCIMFCDRMLV